MADAFRAKDCGKIRVGIVGAGCAGLSAAQALRRNGINPVVFEGRNRVGGRILTVSTGSGSGTHFSKVSYDGCQLRDSAYNVDAGASSMHGCQDEGHLVYRRAFIEEIRVPELTKDSTYEATRSAVWYSQGKRISQSVIIFMHDFFNVVRAKVAAYATNLNESQKIALRPQWDKYVKRIEKSQLSKQLNQIKKAVLFKIEARWLGMNISTSLASLYPLTAYNAEFVPELDASNARKAALKFEKSLTDNLMPKIGKARMPSKTSDVPVVDGYTPFLIERLKRGVDVRFKKIVSSISAVQSESNKLNITTKDGDTEEFNFVIVTVPLGVLKSENKSSSILFTPPLSPRKKQAISSLRLGSHNKVILRFRSIDVFWPSTVPQLNCLDRRFQFFNLHAYGKDGVIVAHVFAESGYLDTFASRTDASIVQDVLDVLYSAFCSDGKCRRGLHSTSPSSSPVKQKYDVAENDSNPKHKCPSNPAPVFTLVTRWESDPFAFGSYSCAPIGALFDDITEIRKPERLGCAYDVLFFAGEHTSDPEHGWQCVNGAYDTGLIAASKVLIAAGKWDADEHWSNIDEYAIKSLSNRISSLEKIHRNMKKEHNSTIKELCSRISSVENRLDSKHLDYQSNKFPIAERVAKFSDGPKLDVVIGQPSREKNRITVEGKDLLDDEYNVQEDHHKNNSNNRSFENFNNAKISDRSLLDNNKDYPKVIDPSRRICALGKSIAGKRRRCPHCPSTYLPSGKKAGKKRTTSICVTCDTPICETHFHKHKSTRLT